jgi:hypothetical protein
MNRVYRRSELREQRRKVKERKIFTKMCNDVVQKACDCLKGMVSNAYKRV